MGFAKRMWEEEQFRRYEKSSEAVCAECFADDGIKACVSDNVDAYECAMCGRKSNDLIVAAADRVVEFFLEKIGKHYEDANDSAPCDGEESGFQAKETKVGDSSAGMRVLKVGMLDGIKFFLENKTWEGLPNAAETWLLLRPSGTEPRCASTA